jgi:hypothetical protein
LSTQIDELVEHVTLRSETQAEQLQQLRELWDRLRTPQADRDKFLADLANDGISEDGMTRYNSNVDLVLQLVLRACMLYAQLDAESCSCVANIMSLSWYWNCCCRTSALSHKVVPVSVRTGATLLMMAAQVVKACNHH